MKFLNRQRWDINQFDKVNLPESMFFVEDREAFSDQENVPRTRVLDMPVYMPDQGLRIPDFIRPVFQSIIKKIIAHEVGTYGSMDDNYVYITIDQKMVKKNKTGRRAGAHSDAYVERDNRQIDITEGSYDVVSQEEGAISHTYVVADCLPTEFFNARFPLKDTSCEGSLKTFDEIADKSEVVTYSPYEVLKLTPYVVHRCAIAPEDMKRTFMKISVSNKKYAREGNTRNELFNYDWSMRPRNSVRNHPW